jgi:hypothetical protein
MGGRLTASEAFAHPICPGVVDGHRDATTIAGALGLCDSLGEEQDSGPAGRDTRFGLSSGTRAASQHEASLWDDEGLVAHELPAGRAWFQGNGLCAYQRDFCAPGPLSTQQVGALARPAAQAIPPETSTSWRESLQVWGKWPKAS